MCRQGYPEKRMTERWRAWLLIASAGGYALAFAERLAAADGNSFDLILAVYNFASNGLG